MGQEAGFQGQVLLRVRNFVILNILEFEAIQGHLDLDKLRVKVQRKHIRSIKIICMIYGLTKCIDVPNSKAMLILAIVVHK